MVDTHGNIIRHGDRVVTIKRDGCVPVGSIGVVVRVSPKPKGWSRNRKYPEHAKVQQREGDDWDWAGWYDSDEIAKVTT